ncbi:MAG: hypothetical protein V4655_05070, partial [Bdellovibrionota bacterium]
SAQPQLASPATAKPATDNSINQAPATAKPATDNSISQAPATAKPATDNSINQAPTPAKPNSPVPQTSTQNPNTQTITNQTTTQKSTDTLPKRTIKPADVNLTQPQSQAIQAIRKASNMEQEKRLTDELKLLKAEMNAAMIDATPADEVRKKFELVQRKTLELQKQKFERTLKIRDVLSVEQRKKLNELKSTH